MEPAAFKRRPPCSERRLKQRVGAGDIGTDEHLRFKDRAVDVTFGGEVNNRVDVAAEQLTDQRSIADVAVDELDGWIGGE